MKIPELLAPAGDIEKAKIAIAFGADALYLSGKQYGMRAYANNFEIDELEEIIRYGHKRNVKLYVTVNTFLHNQDLEGLEEYLSVLNELKVDGIIISDVGVLRIAKQVAKGLRLHLSTQANTLNYEGALFWQKQGFKRVILAREVSLADIKIIANRIGCEIEIFVHGSMCVAYSGRCLLSNVMTGRDANQGACTQSCRWKYSLVEQTRPQEYYPVFEDESGTYIFNSNDLCLIEHLPEIVEAGVKSIKIEGRVRSVHCGHRCLCLP